jgi:hypothetical protein
MSLLHHLLKMVVFAQAILHFVVNQKIARLARLVILPDKRNQVDPLDHLPVLARPMPRHQGYLRGIEFVQCAVIDHQPPCFRRTKGSTSDHNAALSGGNRRIRRI